MNIKKIVSISCLFIVLALFINATFKGEKDPLHKRNFNISFTEVKDGQAAKKTLPDELSFKDGKLYSEVLKTKFGYSWLKYRINKDSIFVDEDEVEIRHLEIEAVTTDATNTTMKMEFVVENWDIEGSVKITKNDKPKKYFDFVGFEKGGKPKKEKKPKVDPNKPVEEPKKE